jgi:hypothetical protein
VVQVPPGVSSTAIKVADKITGGAVEWFTQQWRRFWYRHAFDRYRGFVAGFPGRLEQHRSLKDGESGAMAEDAVTLKHLAKERVLETVSVPGGYKAVDGYKRTGAPFVFSEWLPVHRRRREIERDNP